MPKAEEFYVVDPCRSEASRERAHGAAEQRGAAPQGVVEQQDVGPGVRSPRQSQSRLLAAREVDAPLSELGLPSRRKHVDVVPEGAGLRHLLARAKERRNKGGIKDGRWRSILHHGAAALPPQQAAATRAAEKRRTLSAPAQIEPPDLQLCMRDATPDAPGSCSASGYAFAGHDHREATRGQSLGSCEPKATAGPCHNCSGGRDAVAGSRVSSRGAVRAPRAPNGSDRDLQEAQHPGSHDEQRAPVASITAAAPFRDALQMRRRSRGGGEGGRSCRRCR